ncbi:MAG TPA: anhydro-N-acetylmuramic acid kinase [Gemmatimonadales bacterium]|jgi:anhydro-N-acetylmuramic acid kinase
MTGSIATVPSPGSLAWIAACVRLSVLHHLCWSNLMSEAPMLMVGLMSGTSLDGVDAAVVRVRGPMHVELIGFAHRPYSASERSRIDAVLAGGPARNTALLHADLAEWAADAVEVALDLAEVRPDQLSGIAFPGQTIWHEPPHVSWQLGEPAILAERFGVRVVHDFRARDVAAGGQGAPLVPIADALCFAATDHPRLLLNLGGMANVTWVQRRGELDSVRAGDTGPGMAVIDAVARLVDPALSCDHDGALAAKGTVDQAALGRLLADPFFASVPPRSTGREHFGHEYAVALHRTVPGADGVATAVALTVESIIGFCMTHLPTAGELIAAGGGTHHPVLMQQLTERMAAAGITVRRFDDVFFPADAKEAVAFALLGWLTLHGQPGNVPGATGATGMRVLGAVTAA